MIEIFDDKIVLEIEYDGEEILRPILLIMRRTPWYERILKAPSGLIINFLLVLFVLYFLGWLSVISAALAFLFSVALTGIISLYIFAWLGRVATFLEHKYRAKFKNIPRPKYKYILDNTGIRKVSSRDVELSE